MCKVYTGNMVQVRKSMVCVPVRSIIPSLKLGDYPSVQAHKPCSVSHLLDLDTSNSNHGRTDSTEYEYKIGVCSFLTYSTPSAKAKNAIKFTGLPASFLLCYFYPKNALLDGWTTCDLKSFSTVFQSYQDDGRMIMKGRVQWNPIYG